MRDALACDRSGHPQHLGPVAREGSCAKDRSNRVSARVGACRLPTMTVQGPNMLLAPDCRAHTSSLSTAIDGVGVKNRISAGLVALTLDHGGVLDDGVDTGFLSVALDGFAPAKVHRGTAVMVVAPSDLVVLIVCLIAKDGIGRLVEQYLRKLKSPSFHLVSKVSISRK